MMGVGRPATLAKQRINAVNRRIKGLVSKKPLGTDDPLMAELGMAQIDALLAIGHGINAINSRIQIAIDKEVYNSLTDAWGWRIREQSDEILKLRLEVEELMTLVKGMHGTQIVQSIKPSWWDRIRGK